MSVPLGQILSLLDLIQTVGVESEVSALQHSLQSIRSVAHDLTDRLNGLLNHMSDQPLPDRAEALVKAMRDEIDRVEKLAREGSESMSDATDDSLRADLLGLSEAVVRLRRAMDSLDDRKGSLVSGPRLIAASAQSSGTMTPFGTAPGHAGAKLLLVDDDRLNLKVIGRRLERMGFNVITANRGLAALEVLGQAEVDLVMLDIMMPELDGFGTLAQIRADERWQNLPVIMLTALDDAESTARCLAKGADDYVSKPFDETVLQARIDVALDRKKLRDKEHRLMERVRAEKHVSENLLHSILPPSVANRLRSGEDQLVDRFSAATVIFVDIVGFTLFSATHEPEQTVALLNDLFRRFDQLVDKHGLEKIKTIGDAYLAVAGVPEPVDDHAVRGARLALEVLQAVDGFNVKHGIKWSVRMGLHSGPLVAGIIGSRKFAYDLWGDTVNVASRLESNAQPDQIVLSAEIAAKLADTFTVEPLPDMQLHNRGRMQVFELVG